MNTEERITHADKMGKAIANLLGLRAVRSGGQAGRYLTTWGSKTPTGLYKTLKRIIEDDSPNI